MEFSEFYDVAVALLDSLAGRLSDEAQDIYRSMAWAGEEALMTDMLAGELVERQVALTSVEAGQVTDLLLVFDLADINAARYRTLHDREHVIESLTVVDPP